MKSSGKCAQVAVLGAIDSYAEIHPVNHCASCALHCNPDTPIFGEEVGLTADPLLFHIAFSGAFAGRGLSLLGFGVGVLLFRKSSVPKSRQAHENHVDLAE